jgi:hypothetical protein
VNQPPAFARAVRDLGFLEVQVAASPGVAVATSERCGSVSVGVRHCWGPEGTWAVAVTLARALADIDFDFPLGEVEWQ